MVGIFIGSFFWGEREILYIVVCIVYIINPPRSRVVVVIQVIRHTDRHTDIRYILKVHFGFFFFAFLDCRQS